MWTNESYRYSTEEVMDSKEYMDIKEEMHIKEMNVKEEIDIKEEMDSKKDSNQGNEAKPLLDDLNETVFNDFECKDVKLELKPLAPIVIKSEYGNVQPVIKIENEVQTDCDDNCKSKENSCFEFSDYEKLQNSENPVLFFVTVSRSYKNKIANKSNVDPYARGARGKVQHLSAPVAAAPATFIRDGNDPIERRSTHESVIYTSSIGSILFQRIVRATRVGSVSSTAQLEIVKSKMQEPVSWNIRLVRVHETEEKKISESSCRLDK
uniref:Uncharacterized protein n=1 Tax=Trichogramma kaykai TaxID=54128 RepID=A0ABD2XIP7_9HYME